MKGVPVSDRSRGRSWCRHARRRSAGTTAPAPPAGKSARLMPRLTRNTNRCPAGYQPTHQSSENVGRFRPYCPLGTFFSVAQCGRFGVNPGLKALLCQAEAGSVLARRARPGWTTRGVGIVLIAVGHAYDGLIVEGIYLFHMPLFFFLADVVFKPAALGDYVSRRAQGLLLPYVAFMDDLPTWVGLAVGLIVPFAVFVLLQIGRASCRERV